MLISEFDFDLPPELIAQAPLAQRSGSRLLHLPSSGPVDRLFTDLPALLNDGDLLVVNDSRVIPARLFGTKATGGKVEVLVERITDTCSALAMVRASKSPPAGSTIELPGGATATVTGRQAEFFELTFSEPVLDLLTAHGQMPLPPYITRTPGDDDAARYQTVYANEPGSVAAPTAGLHFDDALLNALAARGVQIVRVTLHVGAGTFSPVRVDDLAQHVMHSERYEISEQTADAIAGARDRGGRVIPVGTTALRTLEGAAAADPAGQVRATSGETNLFISPGYRFRVADGLITNFHLPRSTLLVLVSAMAGVDAIRAAYAHAVAQRYRFFSYGDAMFIDQQPPGRG